MVLRVCDSSSERGIGLRPSWTKSMKSHLKLTENKKGLGVWLEWKSAYLESVRA
jgi:hypothetical protein